MKSPAEIVQKQISIKEKVHRILLKYPATRGDDRLLLFYYLRAYCSVKLTFRQFEELRKIPSPDTLTRRRQEIQAKNENMRPTPKTQLKRELLQEANRNYFGKGLKLTDFMREIA